MKKSIKYTLFSLLVAMSLISCNSGESLQTYFVDNQEKADFVTADIPTSIVELDEATLTDEQKEAYKSVQRLNFLGFKASETNMATYNTELAKVKAILSDVKYTELMEFRDSGMTFVISYLGDDDSAEEVIVFGSSKEMGFGVVRILGDNMRPEQIGTLASAVQNTNFEDSDQLKDIVNFFK
ncbi:MULTISPECIES: DUF4252 domain-containing protein [Bizionia]|uniref:DUF4252 domain-containing protein n=1 Tax=Bizionia algoritergicola TaxID=291187 RepID=A0A5D0QQ44_9FLAO|nr:MULTISPECIES: DUF4252 domain-containing protein [Bizionia]OBX22276.1 hypothetical protein BAA08_09285 [Bizionia sp. APA-3]TYB70831.1 DUF4252 domain-containing protein [Bizionia algoritergicola]